MPVVTVTKAYLRYWKRLSKQHQGLADDAMKAFEANPTAHKLNFHPVISRAGYFTYRVDFSVRTLVQQTGEYDFLAVAVGNHDLVYTTYFI